MEIPIYKRLSDYAERDHISFAMPGHKRGRGLPANIADSDTTELNRTLNLMDFEDETTKQANSLLARKYGADESFILTCGSTIGIHAMLAAVLAPGDTLLMGADCHMSVINACALFGYKVRTIPALIDGDFLIPDQLRNIEGILSARLGIGAVMISSPTYYGIGRDIEELARLCHSYRIPLIVDEAHGAHFPASKRFPKNATRLGADLAINSAHKTLNALTGAAYLHVRGSLIDRDRLKSAIHMLHSSSPSYIIAATADIARAELDERATDWERLCELCDGFKKRVSEKTYIRFLDNADPTRLVLNFGAYDTTGFEVLERLGEQYGIDAEMADIINVVFIASISNTSDDFFRLFTALNEITNELSVRHAGINLIQPPASGQLIDPQRAYYAKSFAARLENAVNRISAVTVTAYPPGVPIICAGETVQGAHITYIRYLQSIGAHITGLGKDGSICLI